jgi:hypothetical protein
VKKFGLLKTRITFAIEKIKNFFIVKVLVKWVMSGCEATHNFLYQSVTFLFHAFRGAKILIIYG